MNVLKTKMMKKLKIWNFINVITHMNFIKMNKNLLKILCLKVY